MIARGLSVHYKPMGFQSIVFSSSIQLFIFGDFVFIAIFKEIPYGIKFESEEFANIMHFLLKKVEIKK